MNEPKQIKYVSINPIANGRLYMWVADNGSLSPADWKGTGTTRSGRFVEVVNYNPSEADATLSQENPGFDGLGFATQAQLDDEKTQIGAFNFSRPEDLHTNPAPGKGNQAVFVSTGRNTAINQGADLWGTTYVVDVKINRGRLKNGIMTADLTIVYDSDEPDKQDRGIRSPDNLGWADNGLIYIQEDRSVGGFGDVSGEETSIWELNPKTYQAVRVAQVNRTAVPTGQVDVAPNDLGNWETSGIIDVTDEFEAKGERVLFLNVQAHSLRGGAIAAKNLAEGGQFLFLRAEELRGKRE